MTLLNIFDRGLPPVVPPLLPAVVAPPPLPLDVLKVVLVSLPRQLPHWIRGRS